MRPLAYFAGYWDREKKMKKLFGNLVKCLTCLCLLGILMGASCVKNPDGSYSVRVGDFSNLFEENKKTGTVVNKDGMIVLEGCWSSGGNASDTDLSGFTTHDFQWFPTDALAKTEAQADELIKACVHYRPDNRCCRVTLEGAISNGKYEIRRFIKAEQIR